MHWQVGAARISKILDQDFSVPSSALLAKCDSARLNKHASWLQPHFMNEAGELLMSFQSFLVESCGKKIIVDTCRGNDRPLPNGRGTLNTNFLEDLERVVSRHNVDYVMCTHLHYDHVGWNTMLDGDQWVPTFPNAKYLFSRADYAYWSSGVEDDNVDLRFAVDPIVDAGIHLLVDEDFRLTAEVSLEPTPGHTPGHVSVWIRSAGAEALITGDCVHHPVQLIEPDWSSRADVEPEIAAATRARIASELNERGVLVIGTHFPSPTAGRIVNEDGGKKFRG